MLNAIIDSFYQKVNQNLGKYTHIMKEIYTNSHVSQWQVSQLGLPTTSVLASPNLAVFHMPFPYDSHGPAFEAEVDQALATADQLVILCSELHDRSVDFIHRYQHEKIKYFVCGQVHEYPCGLWADWFITTVDHYNKLSLDSLDPYSTKPKTFDILLGQPRAHRDLIYNFVHENNFNDHVLLSYMQHPTSIQQQDTSGWLLEPGVELPEQRFRNTITPIVYQGRSMSMSQVVPISVYNQTAYTLVTETNYADHYVFFTEKIVKPILARRLFLVLGGRYYLRTLQKLGFQTFNNVIDESYDSIEDYQQRARLLGEQIKYLIAEDQQSVLDQIKPIVEHNYQHMMSTDWYGDFAKELQAVLLDHTRQN